ncbi:hypothetical protein U9M48_042214 [Paspalum notatum var. saurae]|uniref:Uncharacterized protein n=1 Tax=Paspalum notatum var. saurae TaxID=547442 RepID=A0AAQ3XF01_PASNO
MPNPQAGAQATGIGAQAFYGVQNPLVGAPVPRCGVALAREPLELDFGAGCQALAPHVRRVPWPTKFRPHLPEKFDGTVDPQEFLQIYSTAIIAAGGTNDVMANYFHVALTEADRTWLLNLLEGSVASWEALCRLFIANFAGSTPRAGSEVDLHAGVRDEKMLEKLATHEIYDVGDLLALAHKCARATEGRA